MIVPERSLRKQCLDLVRRIDIPVPWDFGEFCELLERRRGRPLRIMPSSIPALPGAPCGVCIPAETTDYVFVVDGTTSYHREHIALHEIGHLLFGHQGDGVGLSDLAHLLTPDIDPALIERIFGRTAYSSRQEQEAEYFATLIHAQVEHSAGVPVAGDPKAAEVLDRLERSWGHRAVTRR